MNEPTDIGRIDEHAHRSLWLLAAGGGALLVTALFALFAFR
ncbi:MAG: hypothetical protein R3F60_07450 [bacterium]